MNNPLRFFEEKVVDQIHAQIQQQFLEGKSISQYTSLDQSVNFTWDIMPEKMLHWIFLYKQIKHPEVYGRPVKVGRMIHRGYYF